MGFLTLGRRFINNVHDIIDDRIDVVSRGLMGLTVACARCHDHKFDPIPTADYYSLYGVFASCREPVEKPRIGKPSENAAYAQYEKELAARKQAMEAFRRARHDELKAALRMQCESYLVRTLEPATENPSGGAIYVSLGDFRPRMVDRWRSYIQQAVSRHDPVFEPWRLLASLAHQGFAVQAARILADLTLRPAGDPGGRVNGIILSRLLAEMPVSMKQVARVYGEVLTEIERKWRQEYAASTQPAGQAISAMLDPQEEELRQVLYAAGTPTALELEESTRLFNHPDRLQLGKLQTEIESFQTRLARRPRRGRWF